MLSFQELRLQRELSFTAQDFLLGIKTVGQAESEEQMQPQGVHSAGERAWQRIASRLQRQLIPKGLKISHKKSRVSLASAGQIPTGCAAIRVPSLTPGGRQRKSTVAQPFAATSRLMHF